MSLKVEKISSALESHFILSTKERALTSPLDLASTFQSCFEETNERARRPFVTEGASEACVLKARCPRPTNLNGVRAFRHVCHDEMVFFLRMKRDQP